MVVGKARSRKWVDGVEMTSLLLVPQMVPTYLKSISWLIVIRFLKKVAPIGKV